MVYSYYLAKQELNNMFWGNLISGEDICIHEYLLWCIEKDD